MSENIAMHQNGLESSWIICLEASSRIPFVFSPQDLRHVFVIVISDESPQVWINGNPSASINIGRRVGPSWSSQRASARRGNAADEARKVNRLYGSAIATHQHVSSPVVVVWLRFFDDYKSSKPMAGSDIQSMTHRASAISANMRPSPSSVAACPVKSCHRRTMTST